MKKIAVFVGSLRKGSFNRMMANELIKVAPEALKLDIVEIANLPLYNQDYDDKSPHEYTEFRETVKKYDGFLFVSPEHNRSIPAALKNALDIGSRPYGQNIWNSKPAAVVTVSIGPTGGFGANHHIRQSLVCLNVPTMPQPEAYVSNAFSLFDKNGNLTDEKTKKFITNFMQSFAVWVIKNS